MRELKVMFNALTEDRIVVFGIGVVLGGVLEYIIFSLVFIYY